MAATAEWLETDYYRALGVTAETSDDEIRKAYRKLARSAHPDANPDDTGAEERFKKISAAYDVVGDPEKRHEYDELRRQAVRGVPGQSGFGTAPGGFHTYYSDGGGSGGTGNFTNFEDLLGDIFGGSTPPGYATAGGPRFSRGQNLHADIRLSFTDAVFGTSTKFEVAGEGTAARTVKTRIPAGVEDGQTIRLAGRGGSGSNGGPKGDLYLRVHVDSHAEFGRSGDNLTLSVPVSYPEAVLGADVTVPTLDGSTVTVRVPPGTSAGRTLRVAGKGVPKKPKPGDLLLTIDIDVPTAPTAEERELVSKLAEAAAGPGPRARWDHA